jgi:hypothetical protein
LAATHGGWRNPPSRPIDDSLNSWTACDPSTCWDLAAKALRTTRDEKVQDAQRAERDRKRIAAKREWEQEEKDRLAAGRKPRAVPTFSRPRLTDAEKQKTARRVPSYTVLDYLFRLRVKTNYEDAGMFVEGPDDENASRRVHRDLVALASCTLLVHELHVGAVIGKPTLVAWADDWLAKNSAGAGIGLGTRRDLLVKHLP